jgi:hypothetical protein
MRFRLSFVYGVVIFACLVTGPVEASDTTSALSTIDLGARESLGFGSKP